VAQFSRPDADVLTTGWSATAGAHYSNLDETTPNGTDVVQSNAVSAGDTNKLRVSMSAAGDPGTTLNHTLRIRALRSNANRVTAGKYALYSAGALVQTGTFNAALSNAGFVQSSVAITSPISDYSDMELEVWGTVSTGSGTTAIRLDHIEFEVPTVRSLRLGESWGHGHSYMYGSGATTLADSYFEQLEDLHGDYDTPWVNNGAALGGVYVRKIQ
jgi:hypothetical protein